MSNDQPSRRGFFASLAAGLIGYLGLNKSAAAPPEKIQKGVDSEPQLVTYTTYDAAGRCKAVRQAYEYGGDESFTTTIDVDSRITT